MKKHRRSIIVLCSIILSIGVPLVTYFYAANTTPGTRPEAAPTARRPDYRAKAKTSGKGRPERFGPPTLRESNMTNVLAGATIYATEGSSNGAFGVDGATTGDTATLTYSGLGTIDFDLGAATRLYGARLYVASTSGQDFIILGDNASDFSGAVELCRFSQAHTVSDFALNETISDTGSYRYIRVQHTGVGDYGYEFYELELSDTSESGPAGTINLLGGLTAISHTGADPANLTDNDTGTSHVVLNDGEYAIYDLGGLRWIVEVDAYAEADQGGTVRFIAGSISDLSDGVIIADLSVIGGARAYMSALSSLPYRYLKIGPVGGSIDLRELQAWGTVAETYSLPTRAALSITIRPPSAAEIAYIPVLADLTGFRCVLRGAPRTPYSSYVQTSGVLAPGEMANFDLPSRGPFCCDTVYIVGTDEFQGATLAFAPDGTGALNVPIGVRSTASLPQWIAADSGSIHIEPHGSFSLVSGTSRTPVQSF